MPILRLAIVAIALTCACSWLFVSAPPADPVAPGEPLGCTTSRLAPTTDTVISAAAFVTTLVWVVQPCNGELCGLGQAILLGTGALVSIPFGASAIHGWNRVNRCRRLTVPEATPPARRPRVASPSVLPGPGERCAHAIEGAADSGICRRGLLCRAGICVEPPGDR